MNYAHKFDRPKPKSELVLSRAESDESSNVSMHSSDCENRIITPIVTMVANNLDGSISSFATTVVVDPPSASDEHMSFLQESRRRINLDESIKVTKMLNDEGADADLIAEINTESVIRVQFTVLCLEDGLMMK